MWAAAGLAVFNIPPKLELELLRRGLGGPKPTADGDGAEAGAVIAEAGGLVGAGASAAAEVVHMKPNHDEDGAGAATLEGDAI